jgi:transcriptional regulator with XRE-family HTH domain
MARAGLSQRALARELGTDASLISKWCKGGKAGVREIRSASHQQKLPLLLGTPKDYWIPIPRLERLAELEAKVAEHERRLVELEARVR